MDKRKLAIAISGVLIGGILLSGGMAFAESTGNSGVAKLAGKIPWVGQKLAHRAGTWERGGFLGAKGQIGRPGAGLSQGNLDQLVQEGTITQDKADQINGAELSRGRQDVLTQLVNKDVLTQAEADAIRTKLIELAQEKRQQKISDALKTLVEKGTITQEQSGKILQSFADAAAQRQAEIQKIENMTVKEARQYLMENRPQTQNNLGQLVTDGVITQEQADAFRDAMALNAQAQNQQRLADGLKKLVDKGTITQDQADKILAKLENVRTEQEALREKIKNMTPEERQQYLKDNKVKLINPISQLVTDGTITRDQAKDLGGILGRFGIGGKPGVGGMPGFGGKSGIGGKPGMRGKTGLGGMSGPMNPGGTI